MALTAAAGRTWDLYVLRAKDGTLYTGISTDVDRRLAEHLGSGIRGARYLRGRGPFRLVYHRRIGSRALALKAEHGVKRLTRSGKERLVAANPDARHLLEMLAL
jgi:putative endonuclease